MSSQNQRPGLGSAFFYGTAFVLGFSFTFAAVQGDYGLFRRVQISAEIDALKAERDTLRIEVGEMQNLTRRLSDAYLDLDLLDQQARDMLGLIRANEIVIR